jgi:2-haloacid dehalogenase
MLYRAVIFDLLTALLDSWSLWNEVAGSEATGLRWRREYLRLTYGTGRYLPYEDLVARAATNVGQPATLATTLTARWDAIAPWPEARAVLRTLAQRVPLAVITNCSEELGHRAAARVGVPFAVVVTAERAGWYKPNPAPYRLALSELGVAAAEALFVAGSPADVPGALGVGIPVVWHNRLGLPPIDGAAQPRATYPTLTPLLDEVQDA